MNGNFKGCIIENCAFSETTMKEVDWSNANTGKINFDTVICENCCFDHINFREHQIVECTLTGCTFKKGNFENVYIEIYMYRMEILKKLILLAASLINNKWENVNFAGADFSEAYIYEDDIRQLKCAGAVLSNINTKEESEEN